MTRARLFGFEVDALRMHEAVARLRQWVEQRDGVCRFVVTPNADHAVVYQENEKLREAYAAASLILVDGMPLLLRARVAWAHDWVSNPSLTATFQTLPGASFIVNGAGVPDDSALMTAGATLQVNKNLSLEAKFDGQFANTSQIYTGTGTVRYAW